MTARQDPVRLLLWTVLALLGIGLLTSVLAGWMGWGWGWHWGGMMILGPLFMLLPILLIVVLVYALTDQTHPRTAPVTGRDALAVAKQRYAAGEITRDEFLTITADIEGRHEP